MTFPANAVPMRWPSGPLAIARAKDLTAQGRQTLERWHDPAALAILDGAPIDCIVLSWAAGLPEDTAQQQTASPLIEAARRRSISTVGWVDSGADPRAAIAAAKSAGLAAVAVPNFRGDADLPVISYGTRSAAPWDSGSPILAIAENLWPGVARSAGSADASAGPTSLPWLDSNGWYVQLARARTRAPIWLAFDPPPPPAVAPVQSYSLAICDSEAAGARWLISLDHDFRAGLVADKPEYRKRWTQLGSTAAFFLKHEEWRRYIPLAVVGVVSDFEGPHLDFAGETLNLMARRDLFFRPIWKSRAVDRPFDGLKVVVYADSDPPEAAWKREIAAFVQQGGLLIAGPGWPAEGRPLAADHPRFALSAVGRGRIARARAALEDPYLLAGDTQSLLSHANDLVKLFNGASSGCAKYTASPDGKRALLQVLSFAAARQAGRTSVWFHKKYRTAGLWTLGASSPTPVDVVPAEDFDGWECHLPATSAETYLALELET